MAVTCAQGPAQAGLMELLQLSLSPSQPWWAQLHVLLGVLVKTPEVMLIFQLNFATQISSVGINKRKAH